MTRKDHRLIADALGAGMPSPGQPAERAAHMAATVCVARALASDNPSFRPAEFLRAAGFDELSAGRLADRIRMEAAA